MIDTIAYYFLCIAQVLNFINPIGMAIATILWVILYTRMRKELGHMYMRYYVLERKIEHIVDREKLDPSFINCMKKLYEDYDR